MATTTTKTAVAPVDVIALGTSKAAVTQVTGGTAARSGTTATFTKAGTSQLTGFSNGNLVWLRGADIMEFNGIFTIANLNQNNGGNSTFTYTIRQDPSADVTGTNMTCDLAIVGTNPINNSTGLGFSMDYQVQNAGTGPTVAASMLIGYASANTEALYTWFSLTQALTTANLLSTLSIDVPPNRVWVNAAIAGNTGQAVDCYVRADLTTSLATS